ncbi:MAG: hypothetical protein O2887_08090 [Bacteroidetes bacterium]|nr:hypothetical protein [Bacteroidota bacterium]MDA1120439.1 hypothetical protein [Bacteroidota bacterium]
MKYIRYCSFLNSIEMDFQNQMIGKTEEQKVAMLQVTRQVIENFRKIYGDQPGVNKELINEARGAAF